MNTGLSPEWDNWFDEAFTDLVVRDPDLMRVEFNALVDASLRPASAPPTVSRASEEKRYEYRNGDDLTT